MRRPSLREGLLACAGLAMVLGCAGGAQGATDTFVAVPSSKVPFAAESAADTLEMANLLADEDLTAIEAADWKPEHASHEAEQRASTNAGPARVAAVPAGIESGAVPSAASPEKPDNGPKGADASDDPEPDGVVIPSAPTPSHDPLDRPKPLPAKPAPAKPTAGNPGADKPGASDPAHPTQAAEEPLPPLNAAIKAALDKRAALPIKGANASEQRKERDAVAFFYAAHGFAPAWSEAGKAGAAVPSVLSRLAAAGDDALTLTNVPAELKTTGTPEEIAGSDLALTEAVVAYARQATGSRVDPHAISPLIGAKPDLADPAEVIDSLTVAGAGAGDKLRALNPTDPRYVNLRDKLAEIRGAGTPKAEAAQIEQGPILTLGMHDPRVASLRALLGVEATGENVDDDLVYDADLAAAVAKFQRRHGLRATGTLNRQTVTAMNGGTSSGVSPHLESTIVANMEIWRWLPHDLGTDRIEVNIPDYLVSVYHDNAVVATNRVVVGKVGTPTPIFSNTMKFLIVNPVWNVPQSIIKNEFNGGTHGFKARYVHGQLFLQQPAGPGNALGRIKFMFPNPYSVYLHDTPAKGLFGTSKRAFSHGCVRVDKPFEFAESVLNDGVPEGGKISWSVKRLEKMLGTTERYVDLPKPLPIHIEYFTASVDEAGKVSQRDDIYGYTAAVAAALGYPADRIPIAGTPATAEKPKHVAGPGSGHASHRYAEDRYERRRAREAYSAPAAPAAMPSSPFGFLPF